ncbi:solute carrier family 10 (sodium/bile acid cotransporter), member 7 [Monaibacterium marinum]|uniref:Solute carrier family 10 (Sodium/bile acid cotransporter), member 7 n=1 Tax=Pontivivens marinum TaxID=1690039 RepID=A0A2C9CRC4_9RHOB|nr:bile acid:sodium symporter family protein [Monaibacterium marinum]SOH93770.1 solute carrier family 10 (sodium/bile acid cotransporter), member 7 [Monaibacterium marinum]
MNFIKRIGIDAYMLLLLATVLAGVVLPAQGVAADGLRHVTFWAVSLLFFLYGAKLDPRAVKAGLTNWRLQGLTFAATYLMFPLIGLALTMVFGPLLGATVTMGLLFLAVLPSTVQSSIAFTSIAGGNVPAAICAASVSNLIGVALTPMLVALFLQQGEGGVSLDAVGKIGVQILLPFVIGQILRPWVGDFVKRHKVLTMTVDRGSIMLIVYSAFSAGTVSGLWSAIPVGTLLMLFVVVWVFLALGMGAMILAGKTSGMDYPDRAVLFYCGSTKSLASGLPIATALFAPDMVGAIVLPLMIYHMSQLLVCAFISQKASLKQNVTA